MCGNRYHLFLHLLIELQDKGLGKHDALSGAKGLHEGRGELALVYCWEAVLLGVRPVHSSFQAYASS
jgi:hypothetical protein